MSKTLYLIIFLSVVLFKSETSFGQDLKKELGICGKTMDGIFEIEGQKDPALSAVSIKNEEFCDNGRYEHDANFVIYLYNANDQVIYDKHIFLSTINYSEVVDGKNGSFKKVSFSKGINSRIVKFPMTNEMGTVTSYKVKSLKNQKMTEMKKIQW